MLQRFLKPYTYKALRLLVWAGAISIGAAGVFIGILIYSLSKGPVGLDFAYPYLQYQLNKENENAQLSVGHSALEWDKDARTLKIHATDLRISDRQSGNAIVNLPEVDFEFRLRSLIELRIFPSIAVIKNPEIDLYHLPDGSYSLKKESTAASVAANQFLDFLQYLPINTFRRISVQSAQLKVHQTDTNQSWHVPVEHIEISKNKKGLLLSLKAQNNQTTATAKALLTHFKKSGLKVNLSAELENFEYDELEKFWFANLAPKVRHWLIENLSHGRVSNADLQAEWGISLDHNKISYAVDGIKGRIDFSGMEVNYLDGLPHVFDAKGTANYTENQFLIDIESAHSKGLKVTKGLVDIDHIFAGDPTIAIDLSVAGPTKNAIELLGTGPLKLAQDFNLKPENIDGVSTTDIHFSFPLKDHLTLQDIKILADSSIKQAHLKHALHETDLKGAEIELKIDEDNLTLKGNGQVNDIPLTFTGHKFLRDDSDVTYQADLKLTPDMLEKMDLPKLFDGTIHIAAQVHPRSHLTHYNVDYSQANVLLPGFLGTHKAGQKGHLKFTLRELKDKSKKLENISVRTKEIVVDGSAVLVKDALHSFEAKGAKLGSSQLDLKVLRNEQGEYFCDLKSKTLDFTSLLDFLKTNQSNAKAAPALHITAEIDRLKGFNDQVIQNVKAVYRTKNNALDTLYLDGFLPSVKDQLETSVKLGVEKDGNGRVLNLVSHNAGHTLSFLGLNKSAHTGTMSITAKQESDDQPWHGKAKIKNFYLSDAPALTKILTIISPFGWIDVVAGKPITFDSFRVMVSYKDGKFLLKNGRAAGKSLGFTFSGAADLNSDTLDVQGSILPYNTLNLILEKVPLVGSLLGGKGGGVLGINYALSGSMSSPDASANPLSFFTPGILRNIFLPFDSEILQIEDLPDASEDEFFNSDSQDPQSAS